MAVCSVNAKDFSMENSFFPGIAALSKEVIAFL